jgi:hypothetical protein
MTLPTLGDIRASLLADLNRTSSLPCHVKAFRGWVLGRVDELQEAVDDATAFTGQARHPEHVAALGFGAAAGLLDVDQTAILADELQHLEGRSFFAAGRPRRFEVDGIAQLGVALGSRAAKRSASEEWCRQILQKSLAELPSDPWHEGLLRLALISLGESNLTIRTPELAVAAAAKGYGVSSQAVDEQAWTSVTEQSPHPHALGRDAVRLAAFDAIYGRIGQVRLASPSREDLINLIRNASRGLKRWTYETEPRTPKSAVARWDIENEYHVQNLLWTILAPVFPDVDDEENLPSIGHARPRADLAVPSLRILIEVKFLRRSGQAALREITEEIAADTSLYLSRTNDFDTIIVVIWDDCVQTEQHHELRSGIETIKGVTAAVIIPRPSRMKRE